MSNGNNKVSRVVDKKQQQQEKEEQQALEDAANMNLGARFINHLLTPGSALSGTMQTAFNAIMVVLFLTWGIFLGSMPDSVHVWIFGFLILGLTLSTNWFMSEVIKMKDEIKKEEEEEKEKKNEDTTEEIEDNKNGTAGENDDNDEEKEEEGMKKRNKKNNNDNDNSKEQATPSPKKASGKRQSKKEM